LQDHVVLPLDLAVRLQVRHGRPVHANVVAVAKVEEFLPRELCPLVGDDRVGYAEVVDDVGEGHCFLRANVHDGSCLDAFGKLVDFYEEVSEAIGCLSEWPHHVEVPHSERPCDGDRLKCLCREMSLPSVELAPLATMHDVLGVHHRSGPVESLSESLLDKCSWSYMVTARAGMDLT
jgi:hypothetical protein